MCAEIKHRGPDDEGVFINRDTPSIGLGHTRLSIIDLSAAGHQPMANEDQTIQIVLNGEIYNYKELRAELEGKGHKFKSNTDTETVVHLYEEYGESLVKYLRGMFAFALWDTRKIKLLLARDRVGKKPLLYFYENGKFCFASEFTSLLASDLIPKKINYASLDNYLTYGYIPAPFTIYENVFKLLPAHTLVFENNEIMVRRYWQLDYTDKIDISEQEAAEEILKLLKEAVKIRLYSDVPLGAFLSGGIDSSTVVALMSQLSDKKVNTFSIGFDDVDYDELQYAKNIARKYGTNHHEFIVRPKALEILPLLVERYGEPYADSSCVPTYYVAQQTKKRVTVALNGDGGDESFAGYERYQAMLMAEALQKSPGIARNILKGITGLLPDSLSSKNFSRRLKRFLEAYSLPFNKRYLRWVSIFDTELKKQLYTDEFNLRVSPVDTLASVDKYLFLPNDRAMLDCLLDTDVHTYLPDDLLVKVDITSMANSLEARSPFLDHKLMEFAARLPADYKIKGRVKKYILKKTIKDLVPRGNIYRKKMGFGAPVGKWLRNDLREYLCDILLSNRCLKRGYFRSETLKGMVLSHIESKKDYSFQLWALLMLELWHRKFID